MDYKFGVIPTVKNDVFLFEDVQLVLTTYLRQPIRGLFFLPFASERHRKIEVFNLGSLSKTIVSEVLH
jgi:hypothetical protein